MQPLNCAPATSPSTPASSGDSTSASPESTSAAYFLHALQCVYQRHARVPVQTPQPPRVFHACTPACNFIQVGDLYVCTATNNYHTCSLQTCNAFSFFDDEKVCDITGNCYPPDEVVPTQYDCARRTAPKRSAATPVSGKRTPKRARLGANGTCEKHKMEALHTIEQVLRPLRTSTDEEVLPLVCVADIITRSESLWRQCIQTKVYKTQPFRYRHRYHVLVVLYACIKGLHIGTPKKTTLVESIDVIRQTLPPFKSLPRRIPDLDQSTFTKTNKIFLACMRELYMKSPAK
jgi:hypothetical protein